MEGFELMQLNIWEALFATKQYVAEVLSVERVNSHSYFSFLTVDKVGRSKLVKSGSF